MYVYSIVRMEASINKKRNRVQHLERLLARVSQHIFLQLFENIPTLSSLYTWFNNCNFYNSYHNS